MDLAFELLTYFAIRPFIWTDCLLINALIETRHEEIDRRVGDIHEDEFASKNTPDC